jgi:hypothetical protein
MPPVQYYQPRGDGNVILNKAALNAFDVGVAFRPY